MAQGKMKVKSKLPSGAKTKKTKGAAITKRINAPVQNKKKGADDANKIKKVVSKNVNKKMEEDLRALATERKANYSKAQQAVIAHNSAKSS